VDVTPLVPAGRQVIQAYGGGGFRIAGAAYRGSVLVFPGRTVAWAPASAASLALGDFAPVLESEDPVEILLLGCGASSLPLAEDPRAGLRAAGVIVDVMDTGAACRTFNVLLGEDRPVAAALIAVD